MGPPARRQAQRPVVAERDARPAGHARRRERGPADHRGERVGLRPQQGGLRPAAAGGGEEPGRAGARVNDPGRGQGARGPADHAPHHRRGCERLARRPPLRRPAQQAERLPQRILPGQDPAPDVTDLTLAGVSGGAARRCSASDQPATCAAPSRTAAPASASSASKVITQPIVAVQHPSAAQPRPAAGRRPEASDWPGGAGVGAVNGGSGAAGWFLTKYSGNFQNPRVEGNPWPSL